MGSSDFIYAALSLFGLGLLIQGAPKIMIAIQILGGLYLLYLGMQLWHSSFHKSFSDASSEIPVENKNAFLLGLSTSLTNPKVIIFYGSILIVCAGSHSTLPTKIMIVPFCGLLSFIWYSFVGVALSMPTLRTQYQKCRNIIDRISGSIMGIFGIALILSDWL
jgi:threonine/homoserine/homoserine lactone efflux protein